MPAQAVREALPAAGLARDEERAEPQDASHRLRDEPRATRREGGAILVYETFTQVVVGKHDGERRLVVGSHPELCKCVEQRANVHVADRRRPRARTEQLLRCHAEPGQKREALRRSAVGFDEVAPPLQIEKRVVHLVRGTLVERGDELGGPALAVEEREHLGDGAAGEPDVLALAGQHQRVAVDDERTKVGAEQRAREHGSDLLRVAAQP